MSLNRITAAQKFIASSKASKLQISVPNCLRCARWQSTGPAAGGLNTFKVLAYGVTATGVMLGGTLVYANYSPSFCYKVDEYIPGFTRLANLAADKWIGVVDTIKPRSTGKVGLNKDSGAKKQTSPVKSEAGSETAKEGKTAVPLKEASVEESSDTKESSESSTAESSVSESTTVEVVETVPLAPSSQPPISHTTDIVHGESLESSSHEEDTQKKDAVVDESQDITVESQPDPSPYAGDPEIPDTSVVEVEKELTADAIGLQNDQTSAKSEDAAQAEKLLQEVYDKYRELDNRTYELHKVLIEAEKRYKDKLAQAVETNSDDKSEMQCTAEDMTAADEEVQTALKNVVVSQIETNEVSQDLVFVLDKASGLGLKSKVEEIRSELSQLHARAMMSAVEYAEERPNSDLTTGECGQKIEQVMDWIKSELGVTLPRADSLQEGIILLLQEKVKLLMQKVEEDEKDYQNYLSAALMKQKEEFERLAEEKVQSRLQEQQREIWKEAQKKQTKAVQQREEELKEQLFIQNEAHTQHLSEALQSQAEQLEAKWSSQMEAKLIQQESYYQLELVKAYARLRGIEAMVDTVANAGETTRQQQSLRTACDTFNAALEQADLKVDPSERYSFTKEISSLRKAAHGDQFILTVLDSIPQEAISSEHGIQSEAGLQRRFRKVKQICKKVALVPEVGGGLGTYALSYLYSFLAINVWKHSSAVDCEKDPIGMDTFELLQYTENLLRLGNMEGAIKFMNCLTGEPKRVAQDWLKDAQLHLETKQAIRIVQNYMAATSVSIIQ